MLGLGSQLGLPMKHWFVLAVALMAASAAAETLNDPSIVPPAPAGVPHTCEQNYPSLAVKRGQQGSTTVRIAILQDGSVDDPELQESSGSDLLDQASLDCVKGWKYTPAMRDGKPFAVMWAVRVEWYLQFTYEGPIAADARRQDPRYVPPAALSGEEHECRASAKSAAASPGENRHQPTVIEYTITSKGVVADQKIVRSSGNQARDDAAMKCTASWHYFPASRDGIAVDARWTASIPSGDFQSRPPQRLSNPEPKSH